MEDEFSEQRPLGRRLLRILSLIAAALVVLLIVAYFVVSSSGFVKGVILPRVAKALNSEITVTDASVRPFSRISLSQLKVQPIGADPLLTADQVTVRYSLLSILRGNYVIDEVTLTAPVIQIVKQTNGTSNLDALSKGSSSQGSSAKSPSPLRVAIRNVSIQQGVVRLLDKGRDGSSQLTELSPINLTLDRLENGQGGRLDLATNLKIDNQAAPGSAGTHDVMEGKVNGSFQFKLDNQLLPRGLTGKAALDLTRAEGKLAELAGLSGNLQAEMTPTELRQLVLSFTRAGQGLGSIQASGPLNLAKSEGRVSVEIRAIDRQVLNLLGASHGWDFGPSTVNATNSIDLARQGQEIDLKGHLAGRQLSLRQQGQASPPLDLDIDYAVSVNRQDQSAVVTQLTINGQLQQQPLLQASLDRPMTLTWAPTTRGFADSTFQLGVSQLNLNDWQSLLGTNLPNGRVDLQFSITARKDGQDLGIKGNASAQDFAAQFGTNRISQAALTLSLEAGLVQFRNLSIRQCQVALQQLNQPVFKGNGSGQYDLSKGDANLQVSAELSLPAALRQVVLPQTSASNGVVRFNTALTRNGPKQSLRGSLLLADFTGKYGSYGFDDVDAGLEYNLNVEGPAITVESAALTVRKGYSAGGTLSLNGTYNQTDHSGQLSFKAVDLNQNALKPLLAPSLGANQLVSISLSGNGSASYNPNGEATLKADLTLTNWVVANAPAHWQSPNLGAQTHLDGALHKEVVELNQFLLGLSPTARAKNQLEIKGRLDLAKTNATPSDLTIRSESLDLTAYYDLFAGNQTTNTAPPRPAAPPPPSANTASKPVEPAPVQLPINQFSATVGISKLYLHDLVITNLQAAAKVNDNDITLKPLDFKLNGQPVSASADLNLGVPGYTYDVSLQGDKLPMEPLTSAFSTNATSRIKGTLTAQAQLKGAGITDLGLKKNLNGNLSVSLTNMDYAIVGPKLQRLLQPISLVLGLPELMQTPINWVATKATVGKGQIDLQQFSVQSQAFDAESSGTIPMADVLTNSPLNLPVNLALVRSLADKVHLTPVNSPTNTPYVQLPNFVTLTGTLGDPKSEVNKLVMGGILARSIGGLAPIGGKAGSLLQNIGGMLAGQSANPASTNGPARTNATSAATLTDAIGNLLAPKKNQPATNPPSASTNTPAKPSALDLLNLLEGKK
jgi:type II secretion system protein N